MLTLLVSCTVYCTSSHPPRAARFDPFYRKVSETVGPTIVFPPLCKREKGRVSAVFGGEGGRTPRYFVSIAPFPTRFVSLSVFRRS